MNYNERWVKAKWNIQILDIRKERKECIWKVDKLWRDYHIQSVPRLWQFSKVLDNYQGILIFSLRLTSLIPYLGQKKRLYMSNPESEGASAVIVIPLQGSFCIFSNIGFKSATVSPDDSTTCKFRWLLHSSDTKYKLFLSKKQWHSYITYHC